MNAPWAISQFGYIPGVLMYITFGLAAWFGGWMIWSIFIKLDSDKYPLRNYGDLGFRVFGTWFCQLVNVLQAIQLSFNVAVIILVNGVALSQMSKFKVCFIVCCLIFMFAGMIGGQIRSLVTISYFTQLNIWINIFVIAATMGVAAHSAPNYTAAFGSYGIPKGPIIYSVWTPPDSVFINQLSSAMQMVYAYGGTMLYCEFMAEMKRPLDFMKSVFFAEIFIMLCYILFGLVLYREQGQFVFNPANQGLSPYGWQTATNALNLVAGVIFSILCGNIAVKVIYQNVIVVLGGPQLHTKKGKILWVFLVPIYWAVAFVIACGIPQISYLAGMVAAVCMLQFSYTFPPILYLATRIKEDAIHPSETFDPISRRVNRIDTWKDLSRWKRGLRKQWWLKVICVVFGLGSAALAVMGMYASILSIIAGFSLGHATSFGCRSPAQ